MKRELLIVAVSLLMGSCAGKTAATPSPTTPVQPTQTSPPTATALVTPTLEEVVETPVLEGAPLPLFRGELFSTAGTCVICHTSMRDESGADVSVDTFWRATMMANSARDPYWQASMRAEILRTPVDPLIIEEKCARCHTPMASTTAEWEGGESRLLEEGFLNPEDPLHLLAIEGVSCTLCHQIQDRNLGQPESFSGGYSIDTQLPMGERSLYGPYSVEESQAMLMQGSSGFQPVQSLHIKESALCATCHTLYTPTFDSAGNVLGEFPEQVPFLEWLNSDYRLTQSCQGCHMPEAEGGVQISITGGSPRAPFSKHSFVGGNTFMLTILKNFGEALGVTASGEQFDATINRTLDQLQNQTAELSLERVQLSGSNLLVDVVVENKAGHKFPTGYPARRAWLHFVARDKDGEVVFESGGINPDGSIVGNAMDEDPARYERHYEGIVDPNQVQIYETVIHDASGNPTTTLLAGAGYLKDNRLLPAGFEQEKAEPDIAVYGGAKQDDNFIGGRDELQFLVDLGNTDGPYTVTVELLYQSISYRWIENLRSLQAVEIVDFLRAFDESSLPPVVIGATTVEVSQ